MKKNEIIKHLLILYILSAVYTYIDYESVYQARGVISFLFGALGAFIVVGILAGASWGITAFFNKKYRSVEFIYTASYFIIGVMLIFEIYSVYFK